MIPRVFGFQYNPDQLLVGNNSGCITQNVVVATGSAVLQRGTVLGRVSSSSLGSAAGVANAGNGTVGSMSVGTGPEYGSYILTATAPTVFSVVDPEGKSLGNATVGTAFTSTEVNFTITAGTTAFVAGDTFTLTRFLATGTYLPCVKTATDGSQTPIAILVDYLDPTSGAAEGGAYFTAEVNGAKLIYDPSWAMADLAVALSARNIYVRNNVITADDPT
ncbi:MAG: head decoration protein [Janthinobacterium lividum]